MNDEIIYREWQESDLPRIAELYDKLDKVFQSYGYLLPSPENVGQLYVDSFRRVLGKFSMVYIAEMNGKVVAFLHSRLKVLPAYMGGVLVGEMATMYIEEEARHRGIAEKLSDLSLAWLKSKQVHSVEIQVLVGNEVSWGLYQKYGFKFEYRGARKFL